MGCVMTFYVIWFDLVRCVMFYAMGLHLKGCILFHVILLDPVGCTKMFQSTKLYSVGCS